MQYLNKSFSVSGAGFGESKLNTCSDTDRERFQRETEAISAKMSGSVVLDPQFESSDEFGGLPFTTEQPERIVDEQGKECKLTSHQKNALYKQAKELRSKIKDNLCTRDECWDPNDRNVNKMIKSEFKVSDKIDYFTKAMKAVGADAKDYDIERMRRPR
jgi:hypothetical protein